MKPHNSLIHDLPPTFSNPEVSRARGNPIHLSRWHQIRQSLWQHITGISIRYKLLGMVLATVLLLGGTAIFQQQAKLAYYLRQSLEERGVALARDLAEDATDLILTQNMFGLNQELRSTLETNPDVRYIFILDVQGRVVAHSFPNRVPPDLLGVNQADHGGAIQVLNTDEGLISDVAVPVFEGKLGTVRLGLSHHRLNESIEEASRQLLITTLIVLIASGVIILVLTSVLTRPIFDLVAAARAVGQGNLTIHPPVRMTDEIGELTAAFNVMVDDLARSRDSLVRQNKELAALNAVAQAISESHTLDQILNNALKSVLAGLECSAGWIIFRQGTHTPQIVVSQGISSDFLEQNMLPGVQPCRCCKIMGGEENWQQPVLRRECPRLQHAVAAQRPETRFTCHLSVPLISHNHPLGIVNLLMADDQTFTPEQITLAGAIGRQIGVAIDAELQRQNLMIELSKREALRGQLLERALLAQEDERRRVARELHDEAGQALTSLIVRLKLLEQTANNSESILHHTAELKRLTNDVLENLHRLAIGLRPASLDHVGLVAALRQYVEIYGKQHNLAVQFEAVGLERKRLSPQMETALYRIVQEALTNVIRHAQATRVDVLLEQRDNRVVVIVEDNGTGFDPEQILAEPFDKHLGLSGIQERAAMLGGTLSIESTPGNGTTIFVEVDHANSNSSGR